MKKFWTILAVAALFVACGGNDKKDEKKAEGEKPAAEQTDKDKAEGKKPAAEQTDKEKAEEMPSDWSIFELKGKVASVTYQDWGMCPFNGVKVNNNGSYVVSFDDSGNVVVPSDCRIIRDDKGVALEIQWYISEWDCWFGHELTYDSKGRLNNVVTDGYECVTSEELHYDNQGRVSKKIRTQDGDGESGYTWETSYEYVAFDAQGNWTERVATTVSDWDGTNTETETRTILYY